MIKALLSNNLSIIEYYFRNISSETIFQFLHDRTDADIILISKERSDEIELLLFKLDDPLINLGLACYGDNLDIIRSLYQSSCFEIRLATLGNKKAYQDYIGPFHSLLRKSEIEEILLFGDSQEQEALLNNPNISSEILFNLFSKKKCFSSISESHWQNLISYSIGNRKLRTSPDYNVYSVHHNNWIKAITAGWLLGEIVSVNDSWAYILLGMYEKLHVLEINDKKIRDLSNRWNQPDSSSDDEDIYFNIRIKLADLIPINSKTISQFSETEEKVLKSSFYKRFVPVNLDELDKYWRLDGELFIINAIKNEKILNSKKFLSKIHSICEELDNNDLFYTHILEKALLSHRKEV